jgi:uridine kinase
VTARTSPDQLVAHLLALDLGHPVRVGIDGWCGAGKTTLARWLVAELQRAGRPALHADSDGFHHVRERRYRQGRDSARGYYEDAYDLDALAERVLRPLGPGGSGEIVTKVHDLVTDEVVDERATVPVDAVVVFAATFVQRGALRELWDEVVWVDTDEETATRRGIARDAAALGGEEAARAAYEQRYRAACAIYVEEERPRERASVILDPSGT